MLTIESLGLSKDELLDRVVTRAVEVLLHDYEEGNDEDGEPCTSEKPSQFGELIKARVKQKTDEAIEQIAAKHILPNITTYVENLCMQETNKWGEKKGEPVTFIEYLVSRAEAYLSEEVDFNGKTKAQDSYNWRKAQTRIAHLVHEHLQYSIQIAMKQALADANSKIVGGIEAAIKIKLAEVQESLKVSVKA